ncbi:hypothetical protein JVX98_13385 [Ensifer sp. PDNC004]|uniref:hypothetical protein n=1 Tax=Ensifer sp. PDNC004 TaxID=2811423 RepID=UPI001964EAB4|nr:hypothetical protein [Ensifer sp. PDNC004]QRY69208.1 hypothetical protein JVX98_13385 [Ensifer sp. PDNC004]
MSKWKLVPVEPTEAMSAAAMRDFDTPFYADLERIYRSMVAAAPETVWADLIEVLIECEDYFDDRAEVERHQNAAAASRIEATLIAEMLGALKAAKADILDYWLPNTARGDDNKALLICRIDKAIDKAEGRL